MYSFYQLSANSRLAMQLLLYLGITAQIATLVLYYFRRSEKYLSLRLLFELGITYHYFVMNLSIGLIQMNVAYNLVIEPYPGLRSLTLLVPLLGVPVLMFQHKNTDLLAIIALILSLPFMEQILAAQYGIVLIFLTTMLFIRSLLQLRLSLDLVLNKISRFSMKEAFDSFPAGLLIARNQGRVMLINKQMRKFNAEEGISTSPKINEIKASWRGLLQSKAATHEKIWGKNAGRETEELLVFENAGRIYRYTEEHFKIKQQEFIQILATDISEESKLLQELNSKNEELAASNRKLELLLQNVEEIELEKESLRMRNRIHDIMGQRLSILHSYLQHMDKKDTQPLEDLFPLLEDMLKDLHEPEKFEPLLHLSNISNAAELAGTRIMIEGLLPEEREIAAVMLRIIREAVTNAIRHGQARSVTISFSNDGNNYKLRIRNDGSVPNQMLKEGEGIRGMRRQLEELAGVLQIDSSLAFCMNITIPCQRLS